jgi:hypothetical protein
MVLLGRLKWLPRNLIEYWKLPRFKRGDIYLDCAWHPVVVLEVETWRSGWFGPWDRDLAGISLLDGSQPRSCSVKHCAPDKVSYPMAEHIVSLMLCLETDLQAALGRRTAGVENIKRIYDASPELQAVWR